MVIARTPSLAHATGAAPGTAGSPKTIPADQRLRVLPYDPKAVVIVPISRGVVTLGVFDTDKAITEVASGLGGDCSKAETVLSVAARPKGAICS